MKILLLESSKLACLLELENFSYKLWVISLNLDSETLLVLANRRILQWASKQKIKRPASLQESSKNGALNGHSRCARRRGVQLLLNGNYCWNYVRRFIFFRILSCISTARFLVLVYGKPIGFFNAMSELPSSTCNDTECNDLMYWLKDSKNCFFK